MVTREFIKKNTEHLLSLFEKICVNEFNTYVWEDDFGNKLRMSYENKDLDNLCLEALFKGEKQFYANFDEESNSYIAAEPKYEYRLTRAFTPEEYEFLASMLNLN